MCIYSHLHTPTITAHACDCTALCKSSFAASEIYCRNKGGQGDGVMIMWDDFGLILHPTG